MANPNDPLSSDGASPTEENESIAESMLAHLRSEMPARSASVEQGFTARPWNAGLIASEAHRLAGAAAYCGHAELQAGASALEFAAVRNDEPAARQAWSELKALVESL